MRFRPEGLLPSSVGPARAARGGERRACGRRRVLVPVGRARGRIEPDTSKRTDRPRSQRWHFSRRSAQRSDSADLSPSTASTSPWSRGPSSASSGPTAQARRPSSTASPASTASTRARSPSTGSRSITCRPDKIAHLGISRTYQNIRLFANMTTMENVLVGLHHQLHASWIARGPRTRAASMREERTADEEARRLLRYVGLQGKGDLIGEQARIRRSTPPGGGARTGQQAAPAPARRADCRA